jgi:hypothetical protein
VYRHEGTTALPTVTAYVVRETLRAWQDICVRASRGQRDARPADRAGLAGRRLHPGLHVGHDRSAERRDAHASQPDLRGLHLRRGRRHCRQTVRVGVLPAALPRRRALLFRSDAASSWRHREFCGIDRYGRPQHPGNRAHILRRRSPHLRKAAAGLSVQARRKRTAAAGVHQGLPLAGTHAVGSQAGECSELARPHDARPALYPDVPQRAARRSRRKPCVSSTLSGDRSRKVMGSPKAAASPSSRRAATTASAGVAGRSPIPNGSSTATARYS